jgi:glycosyltransferase involved in cell wall biosynthesis
MVTTFYPPYNFGGDGIFVRRLSNELAKRGHHVEVVHCIDSFNTLAKPPTSVTYDHHSEITIHPLKSPLGAASPILTHLTGHPFFKKTKLVKILSKRFDVIHYHNISLIGGPRILKYGSAVKLYTMHEYWLRCPTHLLYRFKNAPCNRQHCIFCSLSYKRPPQMWRYTNLMAKMLNHVDAFIAPSQFCMDRHLKTYPNLPIVHLPHFAPSLVNDYEMEPSNSISSYKPYFLFVGRLEKIKGLQTIIPIFKRYLKAKLCIAGSGKFEKRLKQLADGSSNIVFLGYLAHKELQSLYKNAVAVILPSQLYEVFPLVILEAFSAKIPVIARWGGAMAEVVRESRGGSVYRTEQELVNQMDELLADRSHRNKLGRNGQLNYQQRWTVDAHLYQYFNLIQAVIKNKP